MPVLSAVPASAVVQWLMLEEAAVIYLDFNRAFDAVSESLLCKSD